MYILPQLKQQQAFEIEYKICSAVLVDRYLLVQLTLPWLRAMGLAQLSREHTLWFECECVYIILEKACCGCEERDKQVWGALWAELMETGISREHVQVD